MTWTPTIQDIYVYNIHALSRCWKFKSIRLGKYKQTTKPTPQSRKEVVKFFKFNPFKTLLIHGVVVLGSIWPTLRQMHTNLHSQTELNHYIHTNIHDCSLFLPPRVGCDITLQQSSIKNLFLCSIYTYKYIQNNNLGTICIKFDYFLEAILLSTTWMMLKSNGLTVDFLIVDLSGLVLKMWQLLLMCPSDLEVELQQAGWSEPWSFSWPCQLNPPSPGPQPHWLHRAILLLRPDFTEVSAAWGKPSQGRPPSYFHYGVSTGKLLDIWT